MTVHCFTSASFSYLAKARVLGTTLKRFHPDWVFSLCLTDREPPGFVFDPAQEPFDRIIWSHDLPIDNAVGWLFKHEVVEACTGVKGPALKLLLDEGADKVFYLDPDIAVFNSLTPLVEALDSHSVLLTPHQLMPETSPQAVADNENLLALARHVQSWVSCRSKRYGGSAHGGLVERQAARTLCRQPSKRIVRRSKVVRLDPRDV